MSKKEQKLQSHPEKEVVLLGLLAEGPSHAYGLEQKIRERRMTEWTAIGFSSIYRVLENLEEQGLITSDLQQAGPGAARRVYVITPSGRQTLIQGVESYLRSITAAKHPFNVGLAFASHMEGDTLLEVFEERARVVDQALQELITMADQALGPMPPAEGHNARGISRQAWLGPSLLFAHLRRHVEAESEFLKQALAVVKACHSEPVGLARDGGKGQ